MPPTIISNEAKSMLQLGIIIISSMPKPIDAATMPASLIIGNIGLGGRGLLIYIIPNNCLIKYIPRLIKNTCL
jgi:hypothetical protein